MAGGRGHGDTPVDASLRAHHVNSRPKGVRVARVIPLTPSGDELSVTQAGYRQLRKELKLLTTVPRRQIGERLREAREDGDLADNLDLLDALEQQALLERRIAALETRFALTRIVDGTNLDGTAAIGTSVQLRDLDESETHEYELVGTIEADPSRGKISVESPVGRALLGQRAGDLVDVDIPRGVVRFELLAVGAGTSAAMSVNRKAA
jgi:transcription elongation factor GreA